MGSKRTPLQQRQTMAKTTKETQRLGKTFRTLKRQRTQKTNKTLKLFRHTCKCNVVDNLSTSIDPSDCIMNLSHYEFSREQYNVLSKGLSFIPKPKNID